MPLPLENRNERTCIVTREYSYDGLDFSNGRQHVLSAEEGIIAIAGLGTFFGRPAEVVHVLFSRSRGWGGTSTFGDACEYLNTSKDALNIPLVAQALYLVSTSVNDAAVGPGARTVRTTYLDSAGLQKHRTDSLNGTTAVSIGSGYSAIQTMEVETNGSFGAVSAGDITISSINGAATVATTFEMIVAGGNRSLSGRHVIPSDCTGYLVDMDCAAITANMDVRLRADCLRDGKTITPGVFHFKERAFIQSGGSAHIDLHLIEVPGGTLIKVSAIPGLATAGSKLDGNFAIICAKAQA